jgi:hypothetical protein
MNDCVFHECDEYGFVVPRAVTTSRPLNMGETSSDPRRLIARTTTLRSATFVPTRVVELSGLTSRSVPRLPVRAANEVPEARVRGLPAGAALGIVGGIALLIIILTVFCACWANVKKFCPILSGLVTGCYAVKCCSGRRCKSCCSPPAWWPWSRCRCGGCSQGRRGGRGTEAGRWRYTDGLATLEARRMQLHEEEALEDKFRVTRAEAEQAQLARCRAEVHRNQAARRLEESELEEQRREVQSGAVQNDYESVRLEYADETELKRLETRVLEAERAEQEESERLRVPSRAAPSVPETLVGDVAPPRSGSGQDPRLLYNAGFGFQSGPEEEEETPDGTGDPQYLVPRDAIIPIMSGESGRDASPYEPPGSAMVGLLSALTGVTLGQRLQSWSPSGS